MCGVLTKIFSSEWSIPLIIVGTNTFLTSVYRLSFFLHERFKWKGWAYLEAAMAFFLTMLSFLMSNPRHPPTKPEVTK